MANKVIEKLNQKAEAAQQVHWSFWFGVGFFIAVILTMVWFALKLVQQVKAEESAPVTSITVMGEMPYTQRKDIDNAIENISFGNFFQLDVNQVQQQIAMLPWVYSVSVRKNWPNELKIYVVDQSPVALWNGDFLINEQGQAFQADTARLLSPLPAFFGPEGSEVVALENFRNLNKLLDYKDLDIEELVLSERFSWQLMLSDGVTLNLGREERVERIQRFMDVYPQIKARANENQQVDYVDLRYDTGLAVGWKTISEKQRVEKQRV